MKKLRGKITKSRRNDLSVMYVPHKKGGVRTIRINHYRTTLLSTMAILMIALLMLTGYTLAVVKQNNQMKALHTKEINNIMDEKQKLEAMLANQSKQLAENAEIINSIETTKVIADDAVKQYENDYEQLVLAYVDKNMENISTTASRGSKDGSSFTDDVQELRSLISVVEKAKITEDDNTSKIAEKAKKLNAYLSALPTYWPCDSQEMASGFGRRLHPIYKRYITHEGVDLGSVKGSTIYAAAEGKVVTAGWNGGYGKCVVIDHGNGYKTLYGHLNAFDVKVGQWVKKGDKIAKMGNTGLSTAPHLHFEVRVNDVPTDPLKYIEPR